MIYEVKYTIKNGNNLQNCTRACFSSVGYEIDVEKIEGKEYLITYHYGETGKRIAKKDEKAYLSFIKNIPEFDPYIDIDSMLASGDWTFDLTKPAVHFCVMATLVRGLVEDKKIARVCAFIEQKNLYEELEAETGLNAIGLLQASTSICGNIGHWVTKHEIRNTNQLDLVQWNKLHTMHNHYFDGVHKTFNSHNDYLSHSNWIKVSNLWPSVVDFLQRKGYKNDL